jgi:hypothetical protein
MTGVPTGWVGQPRSVRQPKLARDRDRPHATIEEHLPTMPKHGDSPSRFDGFGTPVGTTEG